MDKKIKYIDEIELINKKILLRVDFNVSMADDLNISDDARIKQSLPTIEYLLKNKNRLILMSHFGRPKGHDQKYSLKIVGNRLQQYLPNNKITLVNDFLTDDKIIFNNQNENEILLLENIRFYPEEKLNDPIFGQKLSALAEIYVNDAFGVCHRSDASVVGIPKFLPSYGGLLLKKEVVIIIDAIKNPKKPLVVIIGGAKISTKINLISKLSEIADYLLVGGGLANTFFCAKGFQVGKSICELDSTEKARELLKLAEIKNTKIILPVDAEVGDPENSDKNGLTKKINEIPNDLSILDIGPETQAEFGNIIARAGTIIWNGPVGLFENPAYRRGTDFIYFAITQNATATSIVGGGDTLSAISKKEYLEKITHLSTGGGAMLELIEKGTLPGIEALKVW